MKFRYFAAAAMMGVMCASAPLHAEPQFNGPGGRGGPQGGPNGGPGGGAMHGGPRGPGPAMHNANRGGRGGPARGGDHFDMNRTWRKGDRYDGPRNNRWVINNWQSQRGLYAPPSGYYWMRYGNQFLLTSLTTGIIAGVVSATIGAVATPATPTYAAPTYAAPGYATPGYAAPGYAVPGGY